VTGTGIDSKDDFAVGDVTDELKKTEVRSYQATIYICT
jgi:hypothetical protein